MYEVCMAFDMVSILYLKIKFIKINTRTSNHNKKKIKSYERFFTFITLIHDC